MRSRRQIPALALASLLATSAGALAAEVVPFDSPSWRFHAREHRIEEHLGRPSLYLKDGFAWIEGLSMTDGTLEFDIAFTAERGFTGAAFRMQDTNEYENFYLRPHQSGQPDANQYTPVFGSVSGWQLYHGPGYSAPTPYPYDTWIPVRIAFAGDRADIFVDSEEPSVVVAELKRPVEAGTLGLTAFNAEVHYSNFRYSTERPSLTGLPEAPEEAREGTVLHWQVSKPFSEGDLASLTELPADFAAKLDWAPLDAEGTGITNLARVAPLTDEADTVWVRWTPEGSPRGSRVRFGYSDRVRVFCNGRLLYAGTNLYRSRDYRYLGTIGLFDEIRCPADAGRNEVLFAVSESFGGWGIWAVISEE